MNDAGSKVKHSFSFSLQKCSRTSWFLTGLSGLLKVLRHQLDGVVLHVGDDEVGSACGASVLGPPGRS